MNTVNNKPSNTADKTKPSQIIVTVDDYKVKLNFPSKSEGTVVSDIKRMMLGGAVKP